MSRDDLVSGATWRKSSFSGGGGNSGGECVEVATTHDGRIAIRDSKNRDQGLIIVTKDDFYTFMATCTDEAFRQV